MKVLVVQHSSAICARLLALLGSSGRYDAHACINRAAAVVELVRSCQPAALVMGMRLADGTGFGVLENLRLHAHGLPVILLADSDAKAYQERARALGPVALLNMSSQFDDILPTLDRLLDTRLAGASLTQARP